MPLTSVNITSVSVTCISIPTPWAVGPVNVYLLEDDPLTLIDTGPVDPASLGTLERELAAHGHRIEDLERVVLTHQHVDHWGLARAIVDRSGAELCALAGFDGWLARYPQSLLAEDDFAGDLLRRHGGDEVSNASGYRGGLEFAAAAFVDRVLEDGDVLSSPAAGCARSTGRVTRRRTRCCTTRSTGSCSAPITSWPGRRPRSSPRRSTAPRRTAAGRGRWLTTRPRCARRRRSSST